MIDLNHPETAFAVDAVRACGRLAAEVQASMITPALTKDDKSPVTVADYAVQAVTGCLLDRAFPDDALVGEEDASALRAASAWPTLEAVVRYVSDVLPRVTPNTVCDFIDRGGAEPTGRFWTLDPIDGTKGFLRSDQYAIALALIEDGEVTLGVLGCPNLSEGWRPEPSGPGSIIVARRGEGAWTAPINSDGAFSRLRVSTETDPRAARVLRSFESGHTNVDQLDDVLAKMANTAEPVRMDSQAKYGVLASGQAELLFRLLSASQPDYRECIWDQAAGSIVIEEAGGRITDLLGHPLDFSTGKRLEKNRGVLATNGTLHDSALDAIRTAGVRP